MTQTTRQPIKRENFLRLIIYLMLGSTTLVLTINSYDSGIAKPFLLILFAGMATVVFIAQAIWDKRLVLRKSAADLSVLLFLALILLSAITTAHTWNAQQVLPVWVSFILCFFAGTQLFAAQRDFDKLMRVTAAIAGIVCVFGLAQFFVPEKLFLEFFLGKDRRVTSTLTNALYLGGFIVLLFPTLLAFTVASERTPRERWLLGILLCGLTFLLVVTSTRSSLVAFVISVPMFILLSKRVKKNALLIAVFLTIAGAIYLSPNLLERIEASFKEDSTSTLARREYFWKAGLEALRNAPFFGHGIGSYERVMLDYRSPEYWTAKSEDLVPHAHNEFVETAVDLGSLGVITYLVIIVTILAIGVRRSAGDNEEDRLIRLGLVCSLVAILIDNLANMSLRVVPVGAFVWLFMGILASHRLRKTAPAEIALHIPKAIVVLPVVACAAFIIWFGRDQFHAYESDGHMIKAIVADLAKDAPATINEYQLAIALNHHNLIARSNLALTLLKAGRVDEALEAAEQLESLSPHYPKCNLVQAAALIYLHRYKEALKKIDTEVTLRTHPDAYYYQWIAYNSLGDPKGEIDALEHLLQASINGKISYQFGPVSARIRALVQREDHIKRFLNIYEQLQLLFPQDQTLTAMVAELSAHTGK